MKTHTLFTMPDEGKVLAYYDRHTRLWWAFYVGREEFQIGEAIFALTRADINRDALIIFGGAA